MKRDLPHVVRMAQIQARTDDQLKSQLFSHLRKLSEFQTHKEKLSWVHSEVDRLLSVPLKRPDVSKVAIIVVFIRSLSLV